MSLAAKCLTQLNPLSFGAPDAERLHKKNDLHATTQPNIEDSDTVKRLLLHNSPVNSTTTDYRMQPTTAATTHPTPAVLVIAFNRPDVMRRLLSAIYTARPAALFIAADGPRANHSEDAELCRQTRETVELFDWTCPVRKLYHESNLGLQACVPSAIDWFFSQVQAGIILEDDCLASADFFPFAGEMLARYAETDRVMHVSGLNMLPAQKFTPYSYLFTDVGHIWGWATWRRAWQYFDQELTDWPQRRADFNMSAAPLHRALGHKFASAHAGRKATWSRAWYYAVLRRAGLAIVPAKNLIKNVGFGDDATHTTSIRHPLRVTEYGKLNFPLNHPDSFDTNAAYHRLLTRYHRGSYRRQLGNMFYWLVDSKKSTR